MPPSASHAVPASVFVEHYSKQDTPRCGLQLCRIVCSVEFGPTFESNKYDSKSAELAQLAERTTLNRVAEGSIPSFGVRLL